MPARCIFLGMVFFLLPFFSDAQYGNIWTFGNYAGIDFNTTPPTAIQTSIRTNEGCATICDEDGQLLFYTDGTDVWDRNNNLMPNGKDLPNLGRNITASTTQGALIVPIPGNATQYYVFSIGCYECNVDAGKSYYSLIDMSLNNGLGDVVTNSKGIALHPQLTEHMTAVSGDNCDIWLIAITRRDSFNVYNISFNGLDTNAVISSRIRGAGSYVGILGSLDIAPSRRKLAAAQGNLVIYDFDPATGLISNPFVIDKEAPDGGGYYGVAFSPDNTKLYASTPLTIYQFDLNLNDTTAIIASKVRLGSANYGALKRAPNGKVYYSRMERDALSTINKPNLAGSACELVENGFPLKSGTSATFGLPNLATIVVNKKIYSSSADTAFCADSLLLRPANPNGSHYTWEDGSTDTNRYVYKTGTYWVTYKHMLPSACEEYSDTFKVVMNNIRKIHTTTELEGMCLTDTFLLRASHPDGSHYKWEDGNMAQSKKIYETGTYWVSYQNDSLCTHYADTFVVTYPKENYNLSFTADTLICQPDTLFFKNTSDSHFNQFSWSFGDGNSSKDKDPAHIYEEGGDYIIRLIGKIGDICPDTAYANLSVDPVILLGFTTDQDSICIGESISFSHQVNSSTITQLLWDFGDGTQQDALSGNISHAYDRAGSMIPVFLKAGFRVCPDAVFSDTIAVFELPEVDLGGDQALCLDANPVILRNLRPETDGTRFKWNTGDTSKTLKVVHPGIYSLSVTQNPSGCHNTETVEIRRDCYIDIPNAFSPDGDGVNDYFFPRQLLSKNITGFRMQVRNRWGQVVFETATTNGRGWDGRLNGKEQPQGVYVYMIEAEIDGTRHEKYEGNVTLLR